MTSRKASGPAPPHPSQQRGKVRRGSFTAPWLAFSSQDGHRHGEHTMGLLFCSFSAIVLIPSHPPGFSQGISDSQEKQQKPTEYKRIKSFIAFRAVVIGLGRWDDLGGTSRHLTVEVDGDCRGGWHLWPRGRVVPTSLSPAVSAPSVGNE